MRRFIFIGFLLNSLVSDANGQDLVTQLSRELDAVEKQVATQLTDISILGGTAGEAAAFSEQLRNIEAQQALPDEKKVRERFRVNSAYVNAAMTDIWGTAGTAAHVTADSTTELTVLANAGVDELLARLDDVQVALYQDEDRTPKATSAPNAANSGLVATTTALKKQNAQLSLIASSLKGLPLSETPPPYVFEGYIRAIQNRMNRDFKGSAGNYTKRIPLFGKGIVETTYRFRHQNADKLAAERMPAAWKQGIAKFPRLRGGDESLLAEFLMVENTYWFEVANYTSAQASYRKLMELNTLLRLSPDERARNIFKDPPTENSVSQGKSTFMAAPIAEVSLPLTDLTDKDVLLDETVKEAIQQAVEKAVSDKP